MWSITHFPAAMRSLNPTTRAKAIEIANQLLEQGQLDKQHVIAMSVEEARRWARCESTERQWAIRNMQTYA
ncbi:DUF2188 domain-containing protein [Spirosoma sp. HMF3257]|uniref:DUF2188 domain-containing protein n=1 Tax=Spirosoma telluris TaxID=2183553 RepID=A0A327NUW5_9BACT|nr:DUF2188 domain-containing protein [Spirosoma telluris]RAI77806.1 hypothetical protein HMF3257_33330 [Spirosoma telluris]